MPTEPNDNDDDINDDDISTAPLVDQPAFGKGLHRHPIKFVAESCPSSAPPATKPVLSIADQYLSLVFPNGPPATQPAYETCPTCNLPLKEPDPRTHYLSLGHQLALPHTPTPSAIDRSRMGLKYMEKHGFDIDERKGLGATGEGRLYPIIPVERPKRHGIGIQLKKGFDDAAEKVKEAKLDAGKVRKKVKEEKRKAERLRRMFYEDDEVTRYLGELDGQGRMK
jgi:hypothetical protein